MMMKRTMEVKMRR